MMLIKHFSWRVMSRTLLLLVAFAGLSHSAWASVELAKQKNCLNCHTVDKKIVGPAYKEIAVKYKGNNAAADMLAKKIRAGGSGVWGAIPMPANPQVSEAEALTLAKWVLSQK
jgi:cytochrome c